MENLSINGDVIPGEAVLAEMQHHPAKDANEAFRQAARALAVRQLLLQESRRRGLVAGDDQGLLPEEAAIERLFEELAGNAVAASALLKELIAAATIEGVDLQGE